MTEIRLNKGQLAFLNSKARQACLCSGIGGGKSFVLRVWSMQEMIKYPRSLHCYVSLTYRNLMDSAIPEFSKLLEDHEIRYDYLASGHEFILRNREKTKIMFRSQETADTMRSVEIGSLACDELAYWQERNFKTLLGRLREKNGSRRARAGTTPNGFNFLWQYFVKDAKDNRELHRTSSKDNKHLPSDYIEMLLDSYDSTMAEQEVNGLFINVGGKRYYKYDELNCAQETVERQSGWPVVVGMDFNVSPMTAVCAHVYDSSIDVFDEIWLKDSNTDAMSKELLRRYGKCIIVPDAAGNARKTSATRTDHQILREDGHAVQRVRNPHRKDRFNAANRVFERKMIRIDKDCNRLKWDLGTCPTNQEDEGPEQGHISDALGYLIWFYFPIDLRGNSCNNDDDKPMIL